MRSKVSSDWLPSCIKATRPVIEIFKMAAYFPDSLRILMYTHWDPNVYTVPCDLTRKIGLKMTANKSKHVANITAFYSVSHSLPNTAFLL